MALPTTPATKKLTYAQAVAIHKLKCEEDVVYFLRNFVKIQHPLRGKIPFHLYPVQEDALRDLQKYRYNIANKCRQMGFSTLVAGYILWMMTFKSDSNILIVATKLGVATNLIMKIKEMYLSLPKWLQVKDDDTFNKTSIRFVNGSQVKAIAATEDAGRSEALSLLVIDECNSFGTKIKVRNKKTGEIKEVEIGEFHSSLTI